MREKYVSVLVPVPTGGNELFTYCAPVECAAGERVRIEFGRREVTGFVIADAAPVENAKRAISRIDDAPVVTSDLIELTRWMAGELLVPWYRCMETAVPSGLKMAEGGAKPKFARVLSLAPKLEEAEALCAGGERELSCVRMIAAHPASFTAAEAMRKLDIPRSLVDKLVRKGALLVESKRVSRDPFSSIEVRSENTPERLTSEQDAALRTIRESNGTAVLLWGITGSGKTEVYLRAIQERLDEGMGAIVMVPEISLTPQTVDRFRSRLGETVAILHSALSPGERLDEWTRLSRGEARVCVGPRSAVFAPIVRLGMIVIDEAHDGSYKQNETPRYHAIEVARRRAEILGIPLVCGTATPTCELAADARRGRSREARLTARVAGSRLPETVVVDMRKELADGHVSIFSRKLIRELKRVVAANEQAILFLNRRGHSSFVLCRSCGDNVKCPRCAVSLTVHTGARRSVEREAELLCHICNHRRPAPRACPSCGSKLIKSFGAGTERIEEEVRRLFPGIEIARMDADTTARKGAHRAILDTFASGKCPVLVGTQMIGKGLDLSKVTLVGIVAADSSLHLPDFRASERTFHQIVQVIGRAGRREKKGLAVIQTYRPEHPAISFGATQNVEGFIEAELRLRKTAGMPPYSRIFLWTFESEAENLARAEAEQVAGALRKINPSVEGPAPAPLEKLRGRFRWQVRMVVEYGEAADVILALRALKLKSSDSVRVLFDPDPIDLL